jgi:hypothetical protein
MKFVILLNIVTLNEVHNHECSTYELVQFESIECQTP